MLVIVQLTDIHIFNDLDPVLARHAQIGAAISSHLKPDDSLVIAITGDVAYSGGKDQYDLALTFFRRIEQRIKQDFSGSITFVGCPGNHDCDFAGPQDLRNLVLKQIAEKPTQEPTSQLLATCLSVQENFFHFLSELTGTIIPVEERLRYKHLIVDNGSTVQFDCLNLAWVSMLKEDKITFPSSILPLSKLDDGCVVTLMHHPFNWLHPSSYRDFRRRVRANADFIFTGHEHEWNVVETREREAGASVQFEGSVLQDTRSEVSGFTVVEFDLAQQQYKAIGYQWDGQRYARQHQDGWSSFRKFELTAPPDSWVVTKNFEGELTDLGVTLRVGGKAEVRLDDVFVFPDLEASSDDGDNSSSTVYGDSLIHEETAAKGFVLQGDDRSGRTTLLKHFFRKYYETSYVPLIIPGDKLDHATDDGVDAVLQARLRQQYDKSLEQYMQLPATKRVLLVDDFDEVPIRSDRARLQLLQRLRDRCGIFVLSVSDVFQAAKVVGHEGWRVYEDLPKFRVLPFGRLSRAKLVSKWVTIDSDEFPDENERIRRIDESTKYMELVVRWNVVPRYPIYLLTLLQAQKAGSPENFKDSGLGYYYQYLITEAMLEGGVAKDKLTDIEQYCSQLAWWMMGLGRAFLSIEELEQFNSSFSDKWVVLNFEALKLQLQKSRVLTVTGDMVEFRYNYVYYFFVAKYLAENFDSDEVQLFVGAAAQQLHVRSNANILLFLTHFANKVSVVDAITRTLSEQFKDVSVAQFALKNESVDAMLRTLPAVVYQGGEPEENREEEARREGSISDDGNDGLLDSSDGVFELSLSARLTIVFKTIEILGQILKTQYSRITRVRREEIIAEMLDGPLRALEVFYESLRDNPEALVAEFESQLADEKDLTADARRQIAQRVVGSIVLDVTFGFVRKVAEAVGSEAIADDLRAVVRDRGDLGHMLVRLASLLDGQRELPRLEIDRVRREGSGSLIVDRMVQVLVVYRMYMFRTSYPDIRWAHDVLGIPDRITLRTMIAGSSLSGGGSAMPGPPGRGTALEDWRRRGKSPF